MKRGRLQNKVAGSNLTLPVCAALALAVWWLPQRECTMQGALGLVLCALTTYVLLETCSQYHLIRTRTRLMSCVWLVFAASLPFMHQADAPMMAATLLSISYMLLLRCYQLRRPQALIFHAFVLLGAGSFFAPVMLLMALLCYFCLGTFLRALTWRGFWAGILGLLLPFWCYAVWCYFMTDLSDFLSRLSGMVCFETPSLHALADLPLEWRVSAGIVGLCGCVGLLHFLRNNYDDKIRVRMMLYIYAVQTIALTAFLLLQPAQYPQTMALLVVSVSPFIAHYFALTGSILSNLFFMLTLLLIAAMLTLNLWTTSFSF